MEADILTPPNQALHHDRGRILVSRDTTPLERPQRVNFAGREVDVHLDSGSPGGIMLPLELAARLPLASKPVEVARGKRVDQEVVILGAKLNGQVKLGQHVLESPDLRFQDIPGAPGHVGYEFLRRFSVTLDCKNRRVQLDPKSAADNNALPTLLRLVGPRTVALVNQQPGCALQLDRGTALRRSSSDGGDSPRP